MPRGSLDPQIDMLLRLIDESFDKKAWHGSNLKGSIRGISVTEAAFRPAPDRHNIWEIVLHAAYWKYVVWRRLKGEQRGSFPLQGSNWFVRPVEAIKSAWRADLRLLNDVHQRLRSSTESFPPKDLRKVPQGSKVSHLSILTGIAAHDVYHTGQIQILKRLAQEAVTQIR